MDLKNLRCFVALAEKLNFSRAAESMYLSQPSFSVRIQELERELGVPLFTRSKREVFLTDAGSALLPAVRQILEEVDGLPTLINQEERLRSSSTVLRVGIDELEDREDVLPLVKALQILRQRTPEMQLILVPTSFEQYEQQLTDGELDIAIIVLSEEDTVPADFLSLELMRERTMLVAANAGSRNPDEILETHEFLLMKSDLHSRWVNRYIRYLSSKTPSARIRFISSTSSLGVHLDLIYGKTAIFFPESYANSITDKEISIYPIDMPNSDILLTMIWNKHAMNPAIQLMINAAQNSVAGLHRK